uniref:KH_10 domain-containing protein n=1 Tax=Loa loa TaxID=7209 RepID=A0A1I7V955_LOALO
MPIAGHWALRGGFTPRANPRRPNVHFPHQDMFRQSRSEFFVSFYHRSQESAKMFDAMKRRVELAYEQRRKSETNRLQKATNGSVIQYLERIPLSKNVTLTIEIPNAEHAGMMERMEAWCDEDSIPQIMQDTGVLIQFPDLVPDIKNASDYVNRVTLTGPLANVEQARIRIRNFTPVAISFPLRTLKPNILMKDVKNIIDKAIAEKLINFPNIEIIVQSPQLPKDLVPLCVVRGALSHERDICNACVALHRLLFDATNDSEHSSAMIYSTVMDIPAVQQLAVTGVPDGYLIRMISLETKAIIYFPTVADRHFGATIFYLFGSVCAIMKARKYIQGLLPVRLIFDVENNDLHCPVDASNRELFLRDKEHDLTIMIKKSRLEGEQLTTSDTLRNLVTIESEEYNLTNVYAMRHQLLRSSILENEPLIVAKDFNFFKNDFRALIAKSNQVIAESSNDLLAKASSLLYSQLNQNSQSSYKRNSLSGIPVIPSPVINDIAGLLPQMYVYQEVFQPSEDENIPIAITVGSSATCGEIQDHSSTYKITGQKKTEEGAIKFSASAPSIVPKEQNASNRVNMSVPKFLDFFRQNENKGFMMIPINDFGRPLSGVAVPQKREYIRNINKASAGRNFDGHSEAYNFNHYGNISESKYLCKKSSVRTQSFVPQPQGLMSSGANVVDALISDQGSTTMAVAAAMLQNSPPQWFQSSGTIEALKSTEYFGHMPRIWETKPPETFVRPAECAQSSMASSPEKTWQTKKNLSLKSSFTNKNYIREYHHDMSANTVRDVPQGLSARDYYNKTVMLSTIHTITEQSTSQREYQGRSSQNSLRSSDMVRGGRIVRQSRNHFGGHYSSFSRSLSSSSYGEGERCYNRGMAHTGFKRQFVNGTQLEEQGKGSRRGERYHSLHQEQQHGCVCDQFGKDSEELNNNIKVASPPKLLVRTKTCANTRKRIDVMVLIDEVQRSQNEQSSRNVQQLNSPFHIKF